jgi:ATP-dependent helicase/nuclease subunit B
MSTPILIPPGYDIIQEIGGRLIHHDRDYSGSLAVFPGKRPAYYLRKKIAGLTGTGYIPPHIMSMDEFVDYIYEHELNIIDRKIDQLDAAALLYGIHGTVNAPVGEHHFKRVDDFLPLAVNIFEELEEFCIAGITPNQLRSVLSGYDTGQIGSLETYFSRFYEKLSAEKYSTRAMRYREAARLIHTAALREFRQIFLAGFFVLTKAERDIFSHLLERDDTIILFQDGKGMQEHLDKLRIKTEKIDAQITQPVIRFHKSTDTHGQIFALSGLLKDMIDNKVQPDEEHVIVSPSPDTLFPLIQHTLPLIPDNNYNISLGYPASRSTLNGFLRSTMEVILSREDDSYYAQNYLRFVLHPYTKNIVLHGASEPSRILFHALEEHFTKNNSLTFFELREIENNTVLFERIADRASGAGYSIAADEFREHLIEIHRNTICSLEEISSIGDFAKKIHEIILFIHGHSTAPRHPLFNHFASHLIESLETLQQSLLAATAFQRFESYYNFYNHYLDSVEIPFSGTPLSGLQVLGFLETRSITFKRVFFLDANDDVISDMRRDESLVPTRVRTQLGIPTYRDRERLYMYYLDLLIHQAQEVDFFYIEKDKKERSRYLEQLAWRAEKSGNRIPTDAIRYNLKLTNTEPSPIPKTNDTASILASMKYSATALDTYLKCQLRFYYRYILKLRERDELAEEIDNLQIGSIVHTILKRYFGTRKGFILTPEDIPTGEMIATVDDVFRDIYGDRISGKAYILRQQIRRRMEEFLYAYQVPVVRRSEFKIIDVETQLEADYNNHRLTGRIDRIEKRDGSIYIIDYKISANADRLKIRFDKLHPDNRSTWYNAIGSLQLPVYKILYENNLNDSPAFFNTIYLLLGKQSLDSNIEIGYMDDPQDDLIIREVLRTLLQEIINPGIDFHPADDLSAECPECPYKQICGTQWTG